MTNQRMRSDARVILRLTLLVWGLVGASSQALATPIYDNGPPDLLNGLFSDTVNGVGFQMADDFRFDTVGYEVTNIHWFGGYAFGNSPASPDDFTVRIYGDAAGVPDASDFIEVFSGVAMRTDTGDDDPFDLDIYEYRVDIDPLMLDADTTYWMSVFNDAVPNGGDPWFWATSDASSGTGNAAFTDGDGNAWLLEHRDWELAFGLGGDDLPTIPEPSAALVFGIGCLVVGGKVRRGPRR